MVNTHQIYLNSIGKNNYDLFDINGSQNQPKTNDKGEEQI